MLDPLSVPLADASSNLLAARTQMGFTLGFHIVLACFGVAFPAMMLIAEWRGRKRGDDDALRLARRWSKAVAVLFAVGAVSGTVLSFEFGLLWPRFMDRFGDAFGIAFAIEGIFFFLEAIFIAIYIYGWDRLSPRAHLWSAVPIVVSGVGGAFSVIAANAWMNQPQGFTLGSDGKVDTVQPFEVLFNPATGYEFFHMLLAAYMVAGFVIASVYAVGMLRGRRDRYHRIGFVIPFTVAAIATPIQLFVGDTAARSVAADQPAKFAGMECVYQGGTDQTEYLGGICTDGQVKGAIGIPGLDSFLVDFNTDAYVTGLDQIPPNQQPPALTMLHLSFDTMVGLGFALLALGAWFAIARFRRRHLPASRWFLRAAALAGVAAVLALECGWIVTEVGRQPWIVQGYMRTSAAVTPAKGIWFVFAFTMALYIALGVTAAIILRAMSRRWREGEGEEAVGDIPYAPPGPPPGAPRSEASA
jgi:cytochrome d ubiquinol oxidase subunit I